MFPFGRQGINQKRGGKILLLKFKDNNQSYRGDNYWDIPGGRIKRGDTLEKTLSREVLEETGITKITSFTHLITTLFPEVRIKAAPNDVGLILTVYICEVDEMPVKLSEEHMEAGWFEPQEASKLLAKASFPQELIDKIASL